MNLGILALTALAALIPLSETKACPGGCVTGIKLNFNATVQASVAADGTVSQKITVNNIPPGISNPPFATAQSVVSDGGVGTANTGDVHMDIFPEIVYTGTCEPVVTNPAACPCVSKAYFWTCNTCGLVLELRFQQHDEQLQQLVYGAWTEGGSLDVTSSINSTVTFQVRLHRKSSDTCGCGTSASDGGGIDGTTVTNPSIPIDNQNAPAAENGFPVGMIAAGLDSICPLGSTPQSGGFNTGSLALQGPISHLLADIANLTIRDPDVNGLTVYRSTSGDQIQVRNSMRLADVLAITNGFEISMYEAGTFSPNTDNPEKFDVVTANRSMWIRYEQIASNGTVHLGGVKVTTTGPNGVDHVKEVVNLAGGGVRVTSEAGLQVEDTISIFLFDTAKLQWERTDVTTVKRDGVLFSKSERTWLYQYRFDVLTGVMLENQEFLLEEKVYHLNSNNACSVTTWVPDPVYLGRAKSVTKPDGSSEVYHYYSGAEANGDPSWRGLLKETLRPWNGQAFDPATATSANSESTVLTYDLPTVLSDVVGPGRKLIRQTTCEPGGSVRIRDWTRIDNLATLDDLVALLGNAGLTSYWQPTSGQIRQECSADHASSTEGIPSTSLTYLGAPVSGCPWVGAPFGSLDDEGNGYVTGYELGHVTNGTFAANTSTTANPGSDVRSITIKIANYGAPAASEATREIVISDYRGRPYARTLSIKSGTTWSDATTTTYTYDSWADGSVKEVTTTQDDRVIAHQKADFIGGDLNMVTWDGQGTETRAVSDALGRIASVTRVGVAGGTYNDAQPVIVTNYNYRGRATTSKVSAGDLWRTEVSVADLTGRPVSQRDASGAVTSTSYSGDGLVTLTTLPGGLTRQVTRNIDGRTVSIMGSAVVAEQYAYSWDNSGNLVTTKSVGNLQNSPRYKTIVQDWAGRVLSTTSPSPTVSDPATVTGSFAYEPGTHRMTSSTSPAGTILYVKPDAASSTTYTGYHVDSDGHQKPPLFPASNDRVTETGSYYAYVEEDDQSHHWWEVSVRKTYDTASSAESAITTITKRCLSGQPAAGVAAKTISISPSDETTTVTTEVDIGSKTVTRTEASNGATQNAVTTIVNGLTVAQTGHDHTTPARWYYNPLGQPILEVSPRGAITRKSYDPVSGALVSVTDPTGNTTRYSYYAANTAAAGRLFQVINPLGGTTTYQYSALGQVTEESGSATHRVAYGYDAYGARNTMKTWRDATNASAWSLTTWTYQGGTGLLASKTDPGNHTTSYAYDSAGRVLTRTWARGVTTTYSYNGFGDLTGITYPVNSGTPNVTFADLDRLGRPTTITQTIPGSTPVIQSTETLSYLAGKGTLNARYYTSGTLLPGKGIRYADPDGSGRPSGFVETSSSNATTVRTLQYGYYGDSGLLHTIQDNTTGEAHTYSYETNSSLVARTDSYATEGFLFRHNRYHDTSGRLLGIRSDQMWDSTTLAGAISYHAYAYDALGRRVRNTFQDGKNWWTYGYNNRSEVVSAKRYLTYDKTTTTGGVTTTTPTTSEIEPLGTGYTFDDIGNRLASTSPVLGDHSYTADSANRYSNITTGGNRTAVGRAPTHDANDGSVPYVVKVGDDTALRIGEVFYDQLTASNSSTPVWQDVVTKRDTQSGLPTMTNHFWYAKHSVTPQYDNDGNLTDDGRWVYTWDAENRLTGIETTSEATATGVNHPYVRITYAYDWMGRMIARHAWKNGTSAIPTFLSSQRWLYDGWNVIAEFSAESPSSTTVTRTATFSWGLDLSGTLRGAGGVGGLLAHTNLGSSVTSFPSFDGNGNIVAWTHSDATEPVSRREYDPFGNALVSEGTAPCSFGFSTKMQDSETGLYYYGYRWYDPLTGRWISLDPIGEDGGVNLYGFVGNSAPGLIDILGLEGGIEGQEEVDPISIEGAEEFEREALRREGIDPEEFEREEKIAENARREGRLPCPTLRLLRGEAIVQRKELERLEKDPTPEAKELLAVLQRLRGNEEPIMRGCGPEAEEQKDREYKEEKEAYRRFETARRARNSANDKPEHLVRFGKGPETEESLAKQAGEAEAEGLPHGVSTSLRNRISGSDKQHRSAPRNIVEAVFGVEQTGKDPRHHTVILPNPVTPEVTGKFNQLFPPK